MLEFLLPALLFTQLAALSARTSDNKTRIHEFDKRFDRSLPWPPAETFEFAVEWPFGGIELTIAELDGAAIAAAAKRSSYYWPDTAHSPES